MEHIQRINAEKYLFSKFLSGHLDDLFWNAWFLFSSGSLGENIPQVLSPSWFGGFSSDSFHSCCCLVLIFCHFLFDLTYRSSLQKADDRGAWDCGAKMREVWMCWATKALDQWFLTFLTLRPPLSKWIFEDQDIFDTIIIMSKLLIF